MGFQRFLGGRVYFPAAVVGLLAAVVACSFAHNVHAAPSSSSTRIGKAGSSQSNSPLPPDTQIVRQHVMEQANLTFREPKGQLKYPYLVPAGPYDSLWDWDSVFMGVALLPFGSARFLAGSMLNFLDWTNATDGMVPGCLTPSGSSPALYHVKPVVIQGAYLAAKATGDFEQFRPMQNKMKALLGYWSKTRLHNATGLYVWYDQMESGADNLVLSTCPSAFSPCWNTADDSLTLSSPDVMVFLYREHVAYAKFLAAWAKDGKVTADGGIDLNLQMRLHFSTSQDIAAALNAHLWSNKLQRYTGFNVSTSQPIENRVFLMAFPIWSGLANSTQAALSLKQLQLPDMYSKFGVRSTSSSDSRYTNANMIDPYSNWRGPVWVLSNVLLSYGMAQYGYTSLAEDLASAVVAVLAADLNATQTWHECYDSETGSGLAAPGFLSWNTLAATWQLNLKNGVNPFAL